jgi:hypothetical protein
MVRLFWMDATQKSIIGNSSRRTERTERPYEIQRDSEKKGEKGEGVTWRLRVWEMARDLETCPEKGFINNSSPGLYASALPLCIPPASRPPPFLPSLPVMPHARRRRPPRPCRIILSHPRGRRVVVKLSGTFELCTLSFAIRSRGVGGET